MNVAIFRNPATWIALAAALVTAAQAYFVQHVSLTSVIGTLVLALSNLFLANQNEKQALQMKAMIAKLEK